ncbi:receptor-type tyrosine-protein phosphatase-like N isoform X2 [Anguilla anguilla]|uniref:receptor-type tyrosine-protein phosphatase-like N isoform X2 n=1 Tax=Anguilla anguilla TaxID=7936 RepID=UPI0015AEEF88|nr:receptor-type tyrosine-protein phosphatase-like N isoform X2 [Anguilla anguilla]
MVIVFIDGCLFQKKVCRKEQLCLNDGLFGQCGGSSQELVQYQISAPLLHRLQEALEQLMMQGLSWQDDITQYIIAKELSRVPQVGAPDAPLSKPPVQSDTPPPKQSWPSPKSPPGVGSQRYLDYMVLPNSPRASLHLQSSPMLNPYTFHQYGYEAEQERSLNSLQAAGYPLHSSRFGGGKGHLSDQDQHLLQDLSPAPLPSHHREASSISTFHGEMDFPLDFTENYVSQEASVVQQHKQPTVSHKALSALDDAAWRRIAAQLQKHGIDVKELSPQQLKKLVKVDAMKAPDQYSEGLATVKMAELMEGAMRHTGGTVPGPPSPPAPGGAAPPAPERPRPSGPPQVLTVTLEASLKEEGVEMDKKNMGPTAGGRSQSPEGNGYAVTNQSVVGAALMLNIQQNSHNQTAEQVAEGAVAEKAFQPPETNLNILQSEVGQMSNGRGLPQHTRVRDSSRRVFLTLVGVACVGGILVAAFTIVCLRHHAVLLAAGKLGLGPEGGVDTPYEYQDLCRQHMAAKSSGRQEAGGGGGARGGGGADTSRVSSVSSQFSDGPQHSPSSHSSTPSWCEEPTQANMDISTGHMILAYMEDHLQNKDRLAHEWEALCSYQAEPSSTTAAQSQGNTKKNRNPQSVPYDHSRVKLKPEINTSRADYINASILIEHDPRMPAYIATQGPLSHTIADFWQMVWESGCTVIVMMTALVEDGQKQCDRYWPDEGSSLYHVYEVNLVSEHIWCNDFLVRSFYLKNVQTQETRTLTQFHFLSWPAHGIPTSTRPLLDFRRKVNKCYRGRSCPIIVHCSDGTGRTGTYILIDMVLNRMAKGVKEIDIAATLEHIRDQRPGMVGTKDQFEFALTAVAEEVNAILKALPQ